MTENTHPAAPSGGVDGDDTAATVALMQDQIDALTATVEAHQRLFERLASAGVLPAPDVRPQQ
jgi:hypothetical protein